MRLRHLFFLPLAAASALRAQEPLNRPVPLLAAPAAPSPGESDLSRVSARRAQELGFPALAASLYRGLLNSNPGAREDADRTDLRLALATALMDDNRPAEAEQALHEIAGPRGAAWHLREGLIAARQGRFASARGESAAIKPDELTPGDRPWYFFLQGMLASEAAPTDATALQAAGNFYQQAERAPGVTDLERARFFLAREEQRLRLGPVSQDVAEQTRRNAEEFGGSSVGFDLERTYAVMLFGLGQRSAAIDALRNDLLGLPRSERIRIDDFRLLLGLIAGPEDGAGRAVLTQLLASGTDPVRQRVALELLMRASQNEPDRSTFRVELDRLIAAATPHPILDDLLYFRAVLTLGDKAPDYAQAESDARELLDRFPGSALKTDALVVLASSAWEQYRYHTAAGYADQARREMPAGETRAELGVLVAEAWFRARDFPSASGAYAAALRERPANVAPGNLMFQRVESEIEAGSLQTAQDVLDQLASDPAFDVANRWRAEWNLARGLQLHGETNKAYGRVNRLLASASPPAGLDGELRVRMAWLQAKLSFDAREYPRTLDYVAALDGRLGGLPAALRSDIAGMDALLEARADFALNRESAGLGTLEKIRADSPATDAAMDSFLIQADHYDQQDKSVDAQRLLEKLADNFPASADAPLALYRAALEAEHRGQQRQNLEEARGLIERLVTQYPGSDLVFDARLKEGNLLRLENEFPQAQEVYESLRNNPNYSRRPDIVYVLLALAECDNAQSASDPGHAESARALFEDLCDRVDAPVDVRVEAGYNLGFLLSRRDSAEHAQTVWWRDVVSLFLLDRDNGARLGLKGRYWMARTLIDLGALYAGEGRQEDARKMWQLVLDAKLPDAELAQERIASLSAPAPKP